MSTGLTYIFITDENASAPDIVGGPVFFNDYNEAVSYGKWLTVYINGDLKVSIWTSSPNPNGYILTGSFTQIG